MTDHMPLPGAIHSVLLVAALLLREMYACRSSGTKSSQGRCSRRDAASLIRLEELRWKVECSKVTS